ncbi:MAG: zinc ribbon domain-containing protein [Methanoregula sp.]|nr:zinc ribbon domain-containing protein [Methanoregula sp.]
MRFCPQCGKPVDETKQFCTWCGSSLNPQHANAPQPDPASTPIYKKAGAPATTRQILMILAAVAVVIIVIALAAVFVFPGLTSPGNLPLSLTKTSTGQTTGNPQGSVVIVRESEPVEVPASGVWVHIQYIGGWKALYGMPGALQTMENSGERYLEIQNGGGLITVVAEKLDGSANHALEAGILKNGLLLASGNTSEAYGKVTISAEAGAAPLAVAQATPALPGNVTITPALTTGPVTQSSSLSTFAAVTKAPVCPSDRVACNGICTDTRTNISHCGFCGNSCPAGKYCLNGNCAVSCTAGQTSCTDGCFDLRSDPKHCGDCANSCPKGLICTMGRCDSPATPMPVPM